MPSLEKQMEDHLIIAIRLGNQIQNSAQTAAPGRQAGDTTREMALSVTRAEEALHWLGKDQVLKNIEME